MSSNVNTGTKSEQPVMLNINSEINLLDIASMKLYFQEFMETDRKKHV